MFRLTRLFILVNIILIISCVVHSTVNIVNRQEWSARTPKEKPEILLNNPPQYVIIHHSETPECMNKSSCNARMQSIQNFHINEMHWNDIGYNFLIGEDGNVYEGRGWGIRGAHSPDYNTKSLGICFIGNFTNKVPAPAAINVAKTFLEDAVTLHKLQSNYTLLGHRQTRRTTCPGQKLYELIQTWPHWKSEMKK